MMRKLVLSKGVAKYWLDEEKGVLVVRTPFSASFLHYIKLHIPKEYRRWNPQSKLWEFEVEQIEKVLLILKKCFDKVIELSSIINQPVKENSDNLFSIIDKDDIKSIYRLLAKKYHPDKGGSNKKMTAINSYFEDKT